MTDVTPSAEAEPAFPASRRLWSRPVMEIIPLEQTLNSGFGPEDSGGLAQSPS